MRPRNSKENMAKKLAPLASKPTHEEIAERARAIFEKSGHVPGRDLENWLQAEAQLLAARKSNTGAEPTAKMPVARRTATIG